MSLAILNLHSDEPTTEHTNAMAVTHADRHRRHVIKKKVVAIGRLSRQLNILRENPESISEAKRLSVTGKLPLGMLLRSEL